MEMDWRPLLPLWVGDKVVLGTWLNETETRPGVEWVGVGAGTATTDGRPLPARGVLVLYITLLSSIKELVVGSKV